MVTDPSRIVRAFGDLRGIGAVSQGRDRLADAIDQARTSHEPVVLTRRGWRIAVIVDAE